MKEEVTAVALQEKEEKSIEDIKLERLRVNGEKRLIVWRATFDLAQNALKSVLLANGAAVTALLTFSGRAEDQDTSLLGIGMITFSAGVALGVLASFSAYLSQYEVIRRSEELDEIVFSRRSWRLLGMLCCFASLGLFVAGVALAAIAIMPPS